MSLFKCPVCGKENSTRFYDPTDFVNDIILIQKAGLGRGMGFKKVEEYSLLDGSNPELLDLISDRVAVVYDMLYDDVEDGEADEEGDIVLEDEEDESLSELEKELRRGEEAGN